MHKAWPQNRRGDFCPIVKCDGEPEKCEIPPRLLKNIIAGKKRKITNANKKAKVAKEELKELEETLKMLPQKEDYDGNETERKGTAERGEGREC